MGGSGRRGALWGAVTLATLAGPLLPAVERARAQAHVQQTLQPTPSIESSQAPAPEGTGFNWVRLEGAKDCISAVELMNQLERRVGERLFVRTGEAARTLDGSIERVNKRGYRVVFELSDVQGKVLGRRVFEIAAGSRGGSTDEHDAADCWQAVRAVLLSFDLVTDPDHVITSPDSLDERLQRWLDNEFGAEPVDPEPATLAVAEGAGAPVEKVQPLRPRRAREPAVASGDSVWTGRALLDISAAGTLGMLPGFAPALIVHVLAETGLGVPIEMGVTVAPAREITRSIMVLGRESPLETTTKLDRLGASLAACPIGDSDGLLLCGGAEYVRERQESERFSSLNGSSVRDAVDLTAAATLRFSPFAPVVFRASAVVIAPLLRHRYIYDSPGGERELFRTSAVGARFELGAGFVL